eukprot:3650402-Pyramimonas_sp.AAC.1
MRVRHWGMQRDIHYNTSSPSSSGQVLGSWPNILIISNRCIKCDNVYATRPRASEHLAASLVRGRCLKCSGSVTVYARAASPPCKCE